MDLMARNTDGRRFTRIPFKRAVRFSVLHEDRAARQVAQDLSQGGLRVLSSEFMPVNSAINVGIQLKDEARMIELEGRVVWVRYNPMTETYQMGVQFADEAAFQRTVIGEFVRAR